MYKRKLIMMGIAFVIMLASAIPAMAATTKTVSYKQNYKNLLGITMASHTATTYWTYYGGTILTSQPRGTYNGWWTAPGIWVDGVSAKWDWFNSSSARSNDKIVFHAGIPTPWGPIGSSITSRWLTTVNGWGGASGYHI